MKEKAATNHFRVIGLYLFVLLISFAVIGKIVKIQQFDMLINTNSQPRFFNVEAPRGNILADDGSLLAISPEGTRAKTDKLKSGFLRIAQATKSKLYLSAFHFGNNRIVLDSFLDLSGDNENDLAYVKEYFTNFEGKCPENY